MPNKAPLRDVLVQLITNLVDDLLVVAAASGVGRAAPAARAATTRAAGTRAATTRGAGPRGAGTRAVSARKPGPQKRAGRPRKAGRAPAPAPPGSVTNPELLLAALEGTPAAPRTVAVTKLPPRRPRGSRVRTAPQVLAEAAPPPAPVAPALPALRADETSMVTRGTVVIRRARREGAQ